MLDLAFAKLTLPKYRVQTLVFLLFFLLLYGIIDYLNLPYPEMAARYGIGLVILNILLDLLMASMGALLMTLSGINAELKGKEGKGTVLGFLSVFFGMLTYGCTSCVIAFFATLGIVFSIAVLPLAGLPYKLVSLLLVALGLLWMILEIRHGKCRLRNKKENTQN